MIYEIYNVPGK